MIPIHTLYFPTRDKTREIVASSNFLRLFLQCAMLQSLLRTLKPVLARLFVRSSLQPRLLPFPLISVYARTHASRDFSRQITAVKFIAK